MNSGIKITSAIEPTSICQKCCVPWPDAPSPSARLRSVRYRILQAPYTMMTVRIAMTVAPMNMIAPIFSEMSSSTA